MQRTWKWHHFEEISNRELYDVLALREEVFVLEQKCFYIDLDYKDQKAMHLLGTENNKLIAYLRLFLPGALYPDAACFGRVVIAPASRGQGIGKELMQQTLSYLGPVTPIVISAQTYLEEFYQSYGFQKISDPYDDCGVMHIDMRKPGSHEK